MNPLRFQFATPAILPLLGLLLGILAGVVRAGEGEFNARLQLVWGTDGEPPDNKEFTKLDEDLQKKFLRHLRWKNYFVVKSETCLVPVTDSKSVVLSKRCTVDLAVVGDDQMKVRIHGVDAEGKPRLVDSKMQSIEKLRQGHVFIYGGDSRDNWDDAWLVVITAAP